MKKIIKGMQTLIVVVLFLVAAFVVLSSFNTPIGLRLFSVKSGSMQPSIGIGSLVVVKPSEEYKVNDIITFRSERNAKETATHRVVEVVKDEEQKKTSYKTKGDANENVDSEAISSNRVVGKVIATIPYLGYVLSFAQTQVGFIALIVIPATLIIYSEVMAIKNEIVKMFRRNKSKEDKTMEEETDEEEKPKKKDEKRKHKKS